MIGVRRMPSLRGQFRWRLVALQALILSMVVTALVTALTIEGVFAPIEPGDDVIAMVRTAATRTANGGPGLADGDKARVFEPFVRLGSGVRGAGLGLHLVAEIVAPHGGSCAALDGPLGGLCTRDRSRRAQGRR